jgi:hypothetical protein
MTPEEHAEVVLTARMLAASSFLRWFTPLLTLVSIAGLVFRVANPAALVVAIAIGVVSGVYAFRVAHDARLFEDIAAGTISTADLDHALGKKQSNRPWPDRCRGARRLLRNAALGAAAQIIALIASSWS